MKDKKRVYLIDEVRGLCIILVVIYHLYYSLAVVFRMGDFAKAYQTMRIWQPILPAAFILISGISFHLSRSNVKRGIKLLLISILITTTLGLVIPDQIIWFGIIHFLAIVNIVFGLLKKYIDRIPVWCIFIFAFLFLLTYNVHRGYLGIEGILSYKLPEFFYLTDFTAPLGFYSSTFYSADYCPVLPWVFMFLIGTILGRCVENLPDILSEMHIKPLAFVGRHTLIIYLTHQPIIVGILYLITQKS